MIRHLLALSDRPAEVDSDEKVTSQTKKSKLLDKAKGSIGFDMNVYTRDMNVYKKPASVHKRKCYIPPFYDGAHGTPQHWNNKSQFVNWGKMPDIFLNQSLARSSIPTESLDSSK